MSERTCRWGHDMSAPYIDPQGYSRCRECRRRARNASAAKVRGERGPQRVACPACGVTRELRWDTVPGGMCRTCAANKAGRASPSAKPVPIEDRIWRMVARVEGDGCWEWLGTRGRDGYGSVRANGRMVGAHIAVYELTRGPVPGGLELDHLCRNRACVNPDHLEPVTHAVNCRRKHPGGEVQCKNGHPWTSENTRTDPRSGKRSCRSCDRERARKRARAKREDD